MSLRCIPCSSIMMSSGSFTSPRSKEMGLPLDYVDAGRNPADPDAVWAQAQEVRALLGWQPEQDLRASIAAHIRALGH